MIIFLSILIVVNIVLTYITVNLFKKNEFYEQTIQKFYSQLSMTLHSMRAIDESQMFESDDAVGSVFLQLTDAINDLRPLLYGEPNDGRTENNTPDE